MDADPSAIDPCGSVCAPAMPIPITASGLESATAAAVASAASTGPTPETTTRARPGSTRAASNPVAATTRITPWIEPGSPQANQVHQLYAATAPVSTRC